MEKDKDNDFSASDESVNGTRQISGPGASAEKSTSINSQNLKRPSEVEDTFNAASKPKQAKSEDNEQLYIGRLCMAKGGKKIQFLPRNTHHQKLTIDKQYAPEGFLQNPEKFKHVLFVVKGVGIKEEAKLSNGQIMKMLGETGDVTAESEAMLIENDIRFEEFSEDCMMEVAELMEKFDDEPHGLRKDLTDCCIFSIDPPSAKDLDDCVSCSQISPGVFEIGVHIADVSYYVTPGSALDKEASNRMTSIYLVDKVIHMIPRDLSEHLCSLLPGQNRRTVSVFFLITEDGEVKHEYFQRTMIRSCMKMGYNHAQMMINEPERQWEEKDLPQVFGKFSVTQIRDTVLQLNKISKQLQRKRSETGILKLELPCFNFALDPQTRLPTDYKAEEHLESHNLIEEYMILANIAVANRVHSRFSESTILRRQPWPTTKQLEVMMQRCATLVVDIDTSSAGSIQRSLDNIEDDDERKHAVTYLCTGFMQKSDYVCTGLMSGLDECHHYSMNLPMYTHFSSPIRRYCDILVHRQLLSALDLLDYPESMMKESLAQTLGQLNMRTSVAHRAQRKSHDIFLNTYLTNHGPVETTALVTSSNGTCTDIFVDMFALSLKVRRKGTVPLLTRVPCRLQGGRGSKGYEVVLLKQRQDEELVDAAPDPHAV